MKNKNILIIAKTLNEGGISKFIERTYTLLKKESVCNITILTLTKTNDLKMVDCLEKNGIKVISVNAINKNPYKYFLEVRKLFKKNKFDIVHWHTDNWVNVYPILLAMRKKETKIIVQSHNSSNSDVINSRLKKYIQNYFRSKSINWKIERIAVSKEASEWMFGPSKKVKILLNPVDIKKFRFNKINRSIIRKKYGITDEILFGNVGRFKEQKNQLFLIDIFNQICKFNNNAKLMLIGSGPLEQVIDKKIEKYDLQSKIIKVSWTKSIDKFYSAFDEIIFPSLYEGFPLALIEAQCTGCPVIFSDTITSEVKIIDSTVSCSLEEDSKIWAENALNNIKGKEIERTNAYNTLLNKEFDYSSYIKKMIALYL
ncbi:glycosyltransferase [Pediococcus pentosaceus]|uniref:glycosyltransferase n=1 Tax=Pediococcus pentosaceus TaxID=1255 RepID=UPI0018A13083|nr:glycosyltransferase [Pediococcus pentosaceus]MBF7110441.1 glycosyltransferase [Pediococcus pentosaceus]MBF7124922.1 glycosyltransferase [Pediococcus pentosaceus]QQA91795.1 glycosyltransferase [Pediococcus pentosaceus]WPK17124.1 glycosyltransferase [Pediococcus pentosaceus]